MSEYILAYDKKEEPNSATSIYQAVEGLFGYLETQVKQFGPMSKGDAVWISAVDEKGITSPCSRNKAINLLQEMDEIQMFCESRNIGIFSEASAINITLHTANDLLRKAKNVELRNKKIIDATQQAHNKIGQLLPTFDDPTFDWHPVSTNPVQILWAAEERIFAYNLYQAVEQIDVSIELIEKEARLPSGTLSKMMHPTQPLRPKKQEIELLARILRVKPTDLWYDAVKTYLDANDLWDKYLNQGIEDHASV